MTDTAIYVRVSTEKQTYNQQVSACEKYVSYKELGEAKVYSDVGSGKGYKDRPQFCEMLSAIRRLEVRNVVVFRLDRLFRNTVEAVTFFQEWDRKGVKIHSLSEDINTDSAMGRAMRDIMLVLASLERENISEATRERLQLLKSQGRKLGRPKGSKDSKERKKGGYYLM
jgi:site-specific DNA recombinase